MLDDDHGVALVHQPLDHHHQFADVLEVQAGGRLIQDVDGAAVGALLQLGGQFHALCLTTGQRGRGLAETDISQSHINQGGKVAVDGLDRFEELRRLGDRHVEDLGDVLAFVVHLEGFTVVAFALADLTRDVHIGQEVHLDLQGAITLAGLAPATLDVEGEASRLVATDLRLGGLGEEVTHLVEDTGVGRRVGARGPADR
ncbi:conserved hypothetical protein [Corynebacterium efficiens YS-314]|uniref:Uncharacterized protein n=1 Tax=Corynebacterium efficiens (strain DSM 44549 / YS-314 / AJ 12310 / JCM 11189 / NBRC 100395) TaxID=196164 RepID=Q8FTQ4_COREF|nr:conserved hypothetical protein [Corynebacterium efficiens YS-314]